MTDVAGQTIKITKKHIQRRKIREALRSLLSRLSNFLRRFLGTPAPKPSPTIRIGGTQRPGAGEAAATNVATGVTRMAGGMKIETKVKNCLYCLSPIEDGQSVARCRKEAAHVLHAACADRAHRKCTFDGYALV